MKNMPHMNLSILGYSYIPVPLVRCKHMIKTKQTPHVLLISYRRSSSAHCQHAAGGTLDPFNAALVSGPVLWLDDLFHARLHTHRTLTIYTCFHKENLRCLATDCY